MKSNLRQISHMQAKRSPLQQQRQRPSQTCHMEAKIAPFHQQGFCGHHRHKNPYSDKGTPAKETKITFHKLDTHYHQHINTKQSSLLESPTKSHL